jgi:hypothetical protein
MSALLIVRAVVLDEDTRAEFDHWYRSEHLPDALAAFRCRRAWRGWSPLEPEVHMAFYEFDTLEQALALPGSETLEKLVAEFDRLWAGRATRTREIIPLQQELTA